MKLSDPSSLLPGLPQGAEVLIVRLRSLGDIVLLTPALAALHAWRPDLRLCVLVEPAWAAVLEGNPAVTEVLLAGRFLPTVRGLSARRFPVVFNHHGGPSSALLVCATASPVRVCWKGRQFSFLYNVLAPDAAEFYGSSNVHTVEQRMTQFYWTGLPRGPIPRAEVFPRPDAAARVKQLLLARAVAGGPYAVLQPGAKYFTKRWPPDRFAALARWLREAHGIHSVVVLGPGEKEIAEEARRHLSPVSAILDSLNLRELIALLGKARIFVGNDSGPTHLAAATGRPVVAIFSSSNSVWWRPWGANSRVVQNDFPCNPCPGDRCYAFAEPRCILSVTLEQVQQACAFLLGSTESQDSDSFAGQALRRV